jgi:hypothetical protein
MKNYYKRYLVLAIIGAAIIGLAFYLLLNSYLDKEEIVVASKDLPAGTIINDEDLEYREYYKNSLPEGYVIDGEEIVGSIINIDRRKHDYISNDMFEIREDEDDFSSLEIGEAVIAIELQYTEPILVMLKNGDIVSIISTVRDKEFINNNAYEISNEIEESGTSNEIEFHNYIDPYEDYIEKNTLKLSDNIFSIDGQIVIRDLEILYIKENLNENSGNILISSNNKTISMYFICSLEEAPLIARLTADNKYKIIYEKV